MHFYDYQATRQRFKSFQSFLFVPVLDDPPTLIYSTKLSFLLMDKAQCLTTNLKIHLTYLKIY